MKQCNICTRYKDESQFARRSDERGDGYQAHCLDCQAEKNKAFYEANRERIQIKQRERKRAIAAGTYAPTKTWQREGGGQKRRVELPPPQKPKNLVSFWLDDAEYNWLIESADQRGMKNEELYRELIRAAMAAQMSEKRKKETNNAA